MKCRWRICYPSGEPIAAGGIDRLRMLSVQSMITAWTRFYDCRRFMSRPRSETRPQRDSGCR
jgi:hypothetical protein